MANVNRPFGLRPVRYLNGAPYNGAVESFYVPASYAPAIFLGDPIVLSGGGNSVAAQGFAPGTLPAVALSGSPAAGLAALTYSQYVMGCVVGILPVTRETNIYKPAATAAVLMCTTDPMIVYEIQDNGGSVIGVGAGGMGRNANLYAGAGSTASGQSGYTLDAGLTQVPATSLNMQLTIYRGVDRGTNDPTATYAIWEVMLNYHPFDAPSIGI
jgi:hypothetical protein